MTKRPHESISASPYAVSSHRQSSYDADGNGSPEDGEGSSLKKPRSFMATLVCRKETALKCCVAKTYRLVIYAVPERHGAMRIAQNVVTVGL